MELLAFSLMALVFKTVAAFSKTSSSQKEYQKDLKTGGEFKIALMSKAFVDKTGFIKEFYEQPKRLYITAPTRFGKSTNMDMIKRFFQPVVSWNGTRIDIKASDNYELFSEPPLYRQKKLEIFKDQIFFNAYFENPLLPGLRPADEKTNDWLIAQLREKKKLFTSMMRTHFNKPCILLIDEYDAPIINMIDDDYLTTTDISITVKRTKSFLSSLTKGNPDVDKVLLTGCMRLANALSPQANIKHMSVLENDWASKFYGFNDEDIANIYSFYSPSFTLSDLKAWYNGYRVPDANAAIYNPETVIDALDFDCLAEHWAKTTSLEHFTRLFAFKELGMEIATGIFGETITFSKQSKLEINQIFQLMELTKYASVTSNDPLGGTHRKVFLQYLLDRGYLTRVSCDGSTVTTVILNKEIKITLQDVLDSATSQTSYSSISAAIRGLNNTRESSIVLRNSVLKMFKIESYNPKKEKEFASMMFTLVHADRVELSVIKEIKTNQTDKGGRSETVPHLVVTWVDREKKQYDLCIGEMKFGDTTSITALNQTLNKVYKDVVNNKELAEKLLHPIENRILCGMAYHGINNVSISHLFNSENIQDAITVLGNETD